MNFSQNMPCEGAGIKTIMKLNPLNLQDAMKALFCISEESGLIPKPSSFNKNLISFSFATHFHLHSLQVENCDSNSRLVVDKDDNGKFRLERVR